MLTLIGVTIVDLSKIDVISRHKIPHRFTKYLFDSRKFKEEERVGDLSNAEGIECEYELKLVFLVVADETHKGILRLVN